MAYVKNITAHYRTLLDALIEERQQSDQPLARASSGRTTFTFTPDPNQNFNRAFTDYFVNGRQDDIGAFDSPKNPGQPIGYVLQTGPNWVELELANRTTELHNGDGLCYYDLQKELVGLAINRAELISAKKARWRVFPKDALATLKDLRKGVEVNRNRDVAWLRQLDKKSSDRRISVWAQVRVLPETIELTLTDEDGHSATVQQAFASANRQHSDDADAVQAQVSAQISRLGTTDFIATHTGIDWATGQFGLCVLPSSLLNALRREAVDALTAARAKAFTPLPRAAPVEPPAPYPEDTLSYLANVYNHKARDFYARHGVKVIDAAFENHQETGEVSLMITKHCVRYSLSLCPKQAKGVIGVQGQVRAEPLQLVNGKDTFTLRFDCKPCEMHVMGQLKPTAAKQAHALQLANAHGAPLTFYKTRPQSKLRT